jgi:hypothetical protein
MKYKLNTGEIVDAKNADELVAILNNTSFFGSRDTIKEFMVDTAARVSTDLDVTINTNTTGAFVADLIKHGYIELI